MADRDVSGDPISWLEAARLIEDHGKRTVDAALKASVAYTHAALVDLVEQLNRVLAAPRGNGKEQVITLRLEPAPSRRTVVRNANGDIAEILEEPRS